MFLIISAKMISIIIPKIILTSIFITNTPFWQVSEQPPPLHYIKVKSIDPVFIVAQKYIGCNIHFA